MKDIKEFLVNEAVSNKFIKLPDLQYVMVSCYDAHEKEQQGYIFKNISEIEALYRDWDLNKDEIKPIIDEVKKLKVNECYIHSVDETAFEVITRIK